MACVARADRHIRKYGEPDEIGTAIAEDLPEMKRSLGEFVEQFKKVAHVHRPDQMRLSKLNTLPDPVLHITRIIDRVHFVEKAGSPILQIADAVAFGLRRYFAGQSEGETFLEAILGGCFADPGIWKGPSSTSSIHFRGLPFGRPGWHDRP
jgi:hypothetical protein